MARKALLIGVGKYAHYPSLATVADSDLSRVETALKNAGVRDVTRLGGGGIEVTLTMLRAAIAELIEKAAEGTDLLVYYTGHGHYADGVTYLVPSDAVTDLIGKKNYLIPVAFDEEAAISKSRSISFVIDACRTPMAGQPTTGSGQPPTRAAGGPRMPRTTIVYASAPGEQAAALPARDGASLFTQAFAELVEAAGQGIPLSELRRRLQDKTEQKGRQAGLDQLPLIDVWPGTELLTEPFPFFRPGKSTPPGRRWSGLLSASAAALGFTGSAAPRFAEACGCLDEIELAAPDLDEPLLRALPDQTLPERLARAAVLVLSRNHAVDDRKPLLADADRLLVIGLAAALEAAARSAELGAAWLTDGRWRVSGSDSEERGRVALTRLGVIAPQFARVYPTLPPNRQRLLEAWCDRVLSLREAVSKPAVLRSSIVQLLPRVYEADLGDSVADLSRYLIGHLHEEFIGRESETSGGGETRQGPVEVLAPASGSDLAVMLDGRRTAALVRLIWLLSADTRLLSPELGLTLSQEGTSPSEALYPLGGLTWIPEGNQIIDLRMSGTSAPLDQALRQLTEEITAYLLSAMQPGLPLHGLDLPRAATATRLQPARRDGKPAFRLPHIRFEASAAETNELLMGTNLYGDAHVAVRELYQNAVDACTYREWRIRNAAVSERGRDGWRPNWQPEIVFSTGLDDKGAWIECRDNGVGMSEYELRESFAKIGKRFRDLPEFLEETAEWGNRDDIPFRPISQFGIGVLSYFMIAKEVVLRTRRSDDRHSRYSDPLLVRISDATGLFRLETPKGPPSDGTAVRLYLRAEFADLDLAKALRQVIAAPLVRTTLIGPQPAEQWEPGHLYDADGRPIPAFTARSLGVYFHEGAGRVLVNGIPLNALGAPGGTRSLLIGVTISLDSRSRPRLSVERSRLLSVDLPAVRQLLVSAAGSAASWTNASIAWLLDLFRTDPAAGAAAYDALVVANRNLLLEGDTGRRQRLAATDNAAAAGGPSGGPVPTSRVGVSVFDVEIGPRPASRDQRNEVSRQGNLSGRTPELSRLSSERRRILWSRGAATPGRGFPVFDDRLITLLSMPRPGMLPGMTGDTPTFVAAPLSAGTLVNRSAPSFEVVSYQLPRQCDDIAVVARESKATLGSVAVFAWAVYFLSAPARIALPRLVRAIDQARPEDTAALLAGTGSARLGMFSATRPGAIEELASVICLTDLPEDSELMQAAFPDAGANEFVTAFRGLTQQVRAKVGPALATGNWDNVGAENQGQAADLLARFPDLFTAARMRLPRANSRRPANQPVEVINAARSLSEPARWAVSREFDGNSPYYEKVEPIQAIRIALAAVNADDPVDPEDVCEELTGAGYLPVRSDKWGAILDAATLLRAFVVDGMDDDILQKDGRVALAPDLQLLAEITDMLGAGKILQLANALQEGEIDADSTRRIAKLHTMRRSDIADLSEVTGTNFPVTINVVSLILLANRRSVSLGESLETLALYRPLSDPHWHLPDHLPPELAARRPSEAELAIVPLASRTTTHDWRVLAVQASALSGISLADLGNGIRPLFSACGEHTEDLDRLCDAWQDPITFDDLLILGCLETWPDSRPEEIDGLCRPSCRWPDDLAVRIRRWLQAAANGAGTPANGWTSGRC